MQFVFFRPLTTTAMVVLNKLHYYGKGTQAMDYRAPQLYITVIQNISIFVAFTGLLKFYHAVDKELQWCRPFAKFLCIKGVVFMTFWQGLAISVLAETTQSEAENWADSAQNFLICLEMLLFSIAHFYCFPTEEWEDGYRVKVSKGKFGDSIALGDFFSDLKMILKKKPKNKKPKKDKQAPLAIVEEAAADDHDDLATEAVSSDDNDDEVEHSEVSADQSDHDIIISALHESLGDDADDPEIAEATRRLLESNVLSPQFFDADDSVSSSEVDTLLVGLTDEVERGEAAPFQSPNRNHFAPAISPIRPDNATGLSENTPLLPSRTGGEEVQRTSSGDSLRPSIFTTVASLAEQMDKDEQHSTTRDSNNE